MEIYTLDFPELLAVVATTAIYLWQSNVPFGEAGHVHIVSQILNF